MAGGLCTKRTGAETGLEMGRCHGSPEIDDRPLPLSGRGFRSETLCAVRVPSLFLCLPARVKAYPIYAPRHRCTPADGSKQGQPVVPPANMQHLVKDAIGALGGNRASPSDDGEVCT